MKLYLLLPKKTNRELLDEMIGIDLNEEITINAENSAKKWEIRKGNGILELNTRHKKLIIWEEYQMNGV